MPRPSKPRKSRRQRATNCPMTAPVHRRLALEIRLAVETLAAAPSPDSFNTLSKMLAALNKAGMNCEALDQASALMCTICDRYEQGGQLALAEAEITTLRKAIAVIDGRMATIPVNKVSEAVASVEVYCASIGA